MGRGCLILPISPLDFKYGTVIQSYLLLGDGERSMLALRVADSRT